MRLRGTRRTRRCGLNVRQKADQDDRQTVSEKPYKVYRAKGGRRPQAAARDLATLDQLDEPRSPQRDDAPAEPGARRDDHKARNRRNGRDGAGLHDGRTVYQAAGAGGAALRAAQPRARRRFFHWWLVPLVVVLALVAAVGVWAFLGYSTFSAAVAKSNARIGKHTRAQLTPDGGSLLNHATTILLLGVDKRPGEPARSDSISLMRINPRTHTVSQLSIPRDMRVAIPGHGTSKINAAFAWGGPPLAVQTVREFTGVPINHVMSVSMGGFPRLIDSVGGIDVNVPQTITSWYTGNRTVTFHKGVNHMDGARALVYSRIRKSDSDFFRMARQQQVLQALEKKIAARGNLPHLPWTGADLMKAVATDLDARQLIELAYLKWRTPARNSHKDILQGTPQYIGGVDYVISDSSANLALLKQFESR